MAAPEKWPSRRSACFLRLETDAELKKRVLAKWGRNDDFAVSVRYAYGTKLDDAAALLQLVRFIVEDST